MIGRKFRQSEKCGRMKFRCRAGLAGKGLPALLGNCRREIGRIWKVWRRSPRRRWWRWSLLAAAVAVLLVFGCCQWVNSYRRWIYNDIAAVPAYRYGLLLGTGIGNLYYRHRIAAAAELYRAGKVRHILVSGDNSRREYDETTAMRDDLVRAGVAAEDIHLDFAGFRTLDSVLRAKRVFGLKRFLIISQEFHCERALYIARRHGIDAEGFAAADAGSGTSRRLMWLREIPARLLAVLDVEICRTAPWFAGPPEPLPEDGGAE